MTTVQLTVLRGGGTHKLPSPSPPVILALPIVQNPTLRTQTYTFWSRPAVFHRAGDMIASYWDQLKMIGQLPDEMARQWAGSSPSAALFPSSWDWDFAAQTPSCQVSRDVNITCIPEIGGRHDIHLLGDDSRPGVSDKVLEGARSMSGLIIICSCCSTPAETTYTASSSNNGRTPNS